MIHLVDVLKYFETNGSGYSAADVTEQWLYYDAMRDPKTGEWQKPRGALGNMVRVTDWRSELGAALLKFGGKKNGALSPNVLAIQDQKSKQTMIRELSDLEDEIHMDRVGNLPRDPEKTARVKKLRARLEEAA